MGEGVTDGVGVDVRVGVYLGTGDGVGGDVGIGVEVGTGVGGAYATQISISSIFHPG